MILFFYNAALHNSSSMYINKLSRYLTNEEIKNVDIDNIDDWNTVLRYLEEASAIVLVSNVVMNSLSAHVISFLEKIEDAVRCGESIPGRFYALLYTDLYEGEQTILAMGILKNFCLRANILWGRGLGIGGSRIDRISQRLFFGRRLIDLNMEYFEISMREQAVHIREHMYGVEDYICPVGVTRNGYMRRLNHEIRKKHRVNVAQN